MRKIILSLVVMMFLLASFQTFLFAQKKKYDPLHGYPPPMGEPLEDGTFPFLKDEKVVVEKKQQEQQEKQQQDQEKFEKIQKESVVLPQQIEGLNLVGYTDEGKRSWDLTGETADIMGDEVKVTQIDANSYGDEDTNLKANKGAINRTTGDVFLEENVVITTQSGTTMTTDTLDWNRVDNVVRTQDNVFIEDENMKIQGSGMEARPGLKEAKLERNVIADIKTKAIDEQQEGRIQITSDGPMEVDQLAQKAVFTKNVVAKEMNTSRVLKADRMEVFFDSTTRKLKEIVCIGNVEVHQDNNVTHSERLVYRAEDQTTVLTGRPKLIIDTKGKDTSGFLKSF